MEVSLRSPESTPAAPLLIQRPRPFEDLPATRDAPGSWMRFSSGLVPRDRFGLRTRRWDGGSGGVVGAATSPAEAGGALCTADYCLRGTVARSSSRAARSMPDPLVLAAVSAVITASAMRRSSAVFPAAAARRASSR